MDIERPDLDDIDPQVRAYIEALEAELAQLRHEPAIEDEPEKQDVSRDVDDAEPPTTINVVTISASGIAKRTPRHLYPRQRRGGVGNYDMEVGKYDHPAFLLIADESQHVLLVTNQARAFRMPVRDVLKTSQRGRGQSIVDGLPFESGERLALAFVDEGRGHVAIASQEGFVRCLLHHYVGENMRAGTALYEAKTFGPPVAACWTSGDDDLFVATRRARAIRFPQKRLPLQGGLAIRLEENDAIAAIAAVNQSSRVFLLNSEGYGTLRLMTGFAANKDPGGLGKASMRATRVAVVLTVKASDDLFIISRLGKLIRTTAGELPTTEGVVSGARCMNLRADEAMAGAASS